MMFATMNDGRGRLLSGAIGIALALVCFGCGSKPDGKPKVENPAAGTEKVVNDPQLKGQPTPPGPEDFEQKFVKALADGKATADDLTLSFKKKIAPPRPGLDDDAKLGYDPDAVDSFFRGKKFPNTLQLLAKEGSIAYFGADKTPSLLILVYTPTGWKVDWLHYSIISAGGLDLSSENRAVVVAARRFLEPLLSGDFVLTQAAMSQAWKVKIAGSDTPSDKALGYSRGFLQAKAREWGHHKGYVLQKLEAGPATATLKGEFTDTPATPFSLKLIKVAGGEWIVDGSDSFQ